MTILKSLPFVELDCVQGRILTGMATATMKISEARAGLARLVDRVMAGEEITLTRRGEAVAVLVSPAALRS